MSVYGEGGWTLVSLDGGHPRLTSFLGSAWASPHPTSTPVLIQLPLPAKEGRCHGALHRLRQDRHEWRPLEKLGSRSPRGPPEAQGETLGGG